MSESLSRRNFLKTSAAGIVVAGAGGLILPKVAQAMEGMSTSHTPAESRVPLIQCNVPEKPERVIDGSDHYIICPSDEPELRRQYSALINVTYPNGPTGPRDEDPVMEGVDFYPFDGSYHLTNTSRSDEDYYLCRSICIGYSAGDNAEVGAPGALTGPAARAHPPRAPRVEVAQPPLPVVRDKIRNERVRIRLEGRAATPPAGSTLYKVRLSQILADDEGNPERPPRIELPQPYERQNSRNFVVLFEGKEGQDFDDMPRRDAWYHANALGRGIYYFMVEAIYDFGKDEKGRIIRRGSSSWLKVDMRNSAREDFERRPPNLSA